MSGASDLAVLRFALPVAVDVQLEHALVANAAKVGVVASLFAEPAPFLAEFCNRFMGSPDTPVSIANLRDADWVRTDQPMEALLEFGHADRPVTLLIPTEQQVVVVEFESVTAAAEVVGDPPSWPLLIVDRDLSFCFGIDEYDNVFGAGSAQGYITELAGSLGFWRVEDTQPHGRFGLLFDDACRLLAEGRVQESERLLDFLDSLGVFRKAVTNLLGLLYLHSLGQPRKALPYLRRAITLAPHCERASLSLFRAYLRVGEVDQAVDEMRRFCACGGQRLYERVMAELGPLDLEA